jgi:hypothetical protein
LAKILDEDPFEICGGSFLLSISMVDYALKIVKLQHLRDTDF